MQIAVVGLGHRRRPAGPNWRTRRRTGVLVASSRRAIRPSFSCPGLGLHDVGRQFQAQRPRGVEKPWRRSRSHGVSALTQATRVALSAKWRWRPDSALASSTALSSGLAGARPRAARCRPPVPAQRPRGVEKPWRRSRSTACRPGRRARRSAGRSARPGGPMAALASSTACQAARAGRARARIPAPVSRRGRQAGRVHRPEAQRGGRGQRMQPWPRCRLMPGTGCQVVARAGQDPGAGLDGLRRRPCPGEGDQGDGTGCCEHGRESRKTTAVTITQAPAPPWMTPAGGGAMEGKMPFCLGPGAWARRS